MVRHSSGWTRASARRKSPLVFIGLSLAFIGMLLGCDDNPTEVQPDLEHNPIAPTANALVSVHHVDGDPSDRSSIYRILEVGDGTWLAYGLDAGVSNVMRLAANGAPLWTSHVESYGVRGVTTVTAPWLPVGLISVGTFDSDNDGQTDNSRVTAWGADGSLLDEIVLGGGDLHRAAIDAAVSASSSDRIDLIVVGSASQTGGPFIPWVARVSLQSDSTLVRGEESTYPTLPLRHLTSVVCDSVGSVFYVGGETYEENGSTATNAFVLRFSDSLQVEWFTDLVTAPGLVTGLGGRQSLAWTGTNVIAVGFTDVVKDSPPASGGYWNAALVASLSAGGAVQWMQSVVLSPYDEDFEACWIDGGAVYAAGQAAEFHYKDSQRRFGYGLLTRLDLTTGEVLANHTFGDPGYESGFNSVVVHGNLAWSAGYTERDMPDRFRTWFAEVDFTRPVGSLVHRQDIPFKAQPEAAPLIETVRPLRRVNPQGVAP